MAMHFGLMVLPHSQALSHIKILNRKTEVKCAKQEACCPDHQQVQISVISLKNKDLDLALVPLHPFVLMLAMQMLALISIPCSFHCSLLFSWLVLYFY